MNSPAPGLAGPSSVKPRATLAFVLAFIFSAGIWLSSPWLTGHSEPWDAEGLFYFGSLFVCGLASGLLIPKPVWAHYAGSVAGQLSYEILFLRIGPLFVLGAGFLLAYSLLFLTGAYIGSRARLRLGSRAAAT